MILKLPANEQVLVAELAALLDATPSDGEERSSE
jgi:hypothetical protein